MNHGVAENYNLPEACKLALFDSLYESITPALTPYDIRCLIAYLEQEMKKLPHAVGPEAFQVEHTFRDGVYKREIFLPAGMIIVGGLHRYSHSNWITEGGVTMITEQGGVEHLWAPCKMISPAATKRALIVHEDTRWITFHPIEDVGVIDIKHLEKHGGPILAANYTELGLLEPTPRSPLTLKEKDYVTSTDN